MKYSTLALVASAIYGAAAADTASVVERTYPTISPSIEEIEKAASNATTLQWTTNIEGKSFNRFVVIWLENTDFDQAAENPDMAWVASQGITLTNYWAVTHPSEPNYMSSVAGDYFALNDDRFISMPKNVSTVVDLLDDKGISWATYQEHLPYTGFQGFNYSNQENFANDYVRKHNPLVLYDSVTSNSTRLSLIKNFTEFDRDVSDEQLPQYVIITPNMTNDAHDTNIKVAGKWTRDFMTPLLSNEYFMNDTLVLITFDENETYGEQNTVYSILLGGVVSDDLKGTTDSTFYDHYSQISSLEANFDLYNLGRKDVDANVWALFAGDYGVTNKEVDTRYMANNETYAGYLLDDQIALPAPNCSATNVVGKSILPEIKSVWESEYNAQVSENYYTSTTTLVTFAGTLTNGASLFEEASIASESGASSVTSTAESSADSVAASGSASGSATASESSSSQVSKAAAAGVVPTIGGSIIALLAAFLI